MALSKKKWEDGFQESLPLKKAKNVQQVQKKLLEVEKKETELVIYSYQNIFKETKLP